MRDDKTSQRRARLYVDETLHTGTEISLGHSQTHYLRNVLRCQLDEQIEIFNGRDGAFEAIITSIGKKVITLVCGHCLRAPERLPDLWLAFAPLRRERTDFMVEKAVELGVTRLCPVQTQYTQGGRLSIEKLAARAIEAAEQCGRVGIPEIDPVQSLDAFLSHVPRNSSLVFCDESLTECASVPFTRQAGPVIILIGPEGGFACDERDRIGACEAAVRLSLGPRVLRAETAALAALTLAQLWVGDWRRE